MAISFIHTADWQIGKVFGNIGADAAVLLKTQRIKTVRRIAELSTERGVDAVLVAGDVFEDNLVSNETIHGLNHAMEGFKGPWVLIPGNHDPALAESVWHRMRALGSGANVFITLEPQAIPLADGRLVILPAVLKRKHEFEDLTATWDRINTPTGALRIGLAHGAVEGLLPGEAEATNPIAAHRVTQARLDYLALGDWHGTCRISERTWYSGTPEPDRFKENDPGNVLHVTIAAPGADPVVERVRVAHYLWREIEAVLTDAQDLEALDARLNEFGGTPEPYVVVLTVKGVVDFKTREQFDLLLSRWRGRFTWIGDDCSQLVAQPTEADLDRIDTAGFVRAATDRLRAIQGNPADPEHDCAAAALRLLYQIHTTQGEHP